MKLYSIIFEKYCIIFQVLVVKLIINIENDFFIDLFGQWTASFVATLRLFLIFEIINPWMELKLTTSHISSHKL